MRKEFYSRRARKDRREKNNILGDLGGWASGKSSLVPTRLRGNGTFPGNARRHARRFAERNVHLDRLFYESVYP